MRFLILLVLIAISLVFLPFTTFAQESIIMTISPTPSVTKTIDYTLPFPGMLPDNPLYFLKTGRDQLIGLLITDPSKKASFDLLQSEKRFQAGLMLYQQRPSKKDLAFATISKGTNYLEEAIHKLSDAQKQGVDVSGTQRQLILSTQKQEQLLRDLVKTHPSASVESRNLVARLKKLENLANKIIKKS